MLMYEKTSLLGIVWMWSAQGHHFKSHWKLVTINPYAAHQPDL